MGEIEAERSSQPSPRDPVDLERVRARDPQALDAFFSKYFDRVYGFCARMLGDRALAEDAAQGVFFKVWRFAERLDASRDPGPWLLTIALRECRDQSRSRARRERRLAVPLDELVDEPFAQETAPERDLMSSETKAFVQEALLRLSPKLRAAIVLHDFQRLSHEDAARVSGLSHAAARKRYSRALAALGKILRRRRS